VVVAERLADEPDVELTLVDDGDPAVGSVSLHPDADVVAKTMQLAVETEPDVREIPNRAYHPTTPERLDGLLGDAAATVGG
jgi:dihydrolipoamide dehydrogenase